MKKMKFIIAIIFFGTIFQLSAQLKVRENGQVMIGKPMEIWSGGYHPLDAENIAKCIIYGPNGDWRGGGRIAFGDLQTKSCLNVLVGEYTDNDTDKLWLHGKLGIYLTSGFKAEKIVAAYDVEKGNYFQFNCDVRSTGVFVASDSSFKEKIEPLRNTLGDLKKLSAVSYQLKKKEGYETKGIITKSANSSNNTKEERDQAIFSKFNAENENKPTRFGFIAQEVEKTYPNLVSKDSTGYLYVDYIGMIPLIVESLNELHTIVNEKDIYIADLEKRADYLEKEISLISMGSKATSGIENLNRKIDVSILNQNTPNPFKEETKISFFIPQSVTKASLYIYNMQGKQLKEYYITDREDSSISIKGNDLGAGMYIYSLIANGKEVDTKRMILTK